MYLHRKNPSQFPETVLVHGYTPSRDAKQHRATKYQGAQYSRFARIKFYLLVMPEHSRSIPEAREGGRMQTNCNEFAASTTQPCLTYVKQYRHGRDTAKA